MFAAARLEKIKELIEQTKSIEISTLVNVLGASEATIRRDLEKLEKEGFLYRIHGGAVLCEPDESSNTNPSPFIENEEHKNKVGYLAAQLVDDNDIIFIGQGYTCSCLAKHLKTKNDLTIITNNVDVLNVLKDCSSINCVCTGGNLNSRKANAFFTGDYVIEFLSLMNVKKAFMCVDGADMDFGFSVASIEEKRIWQQIKKSAQELIVICDSSKFDVKSLICVDEIDVVNKIVTNHDVPEEYINYYYEKGLPIYTSFEMNSHMNENVPTL